MKILFICNDLEYFDIHRRAHMDRMREAGHEVVLASGRADRQELAARYRQAGFVPLDIERQRFSLFGDIALTARIRSLILTHAPDVVHAITIKPVVYSALASILLPSSARRSTRFVLTFPGLGKVFEDGLSMPAGLRKWLVVKTLELAGKRANLHILVENPADKQRLTEAGAAASDRVTVVGGAGLDLSKFRPGKKSGPLKIFFAARLLCMKGAITFADMAERLKPRYPQAEFHMAGPMDPANPDSVPAEFIDRLRSAPYLTYHGALDHDQMATKFKTMDVLCLPTKLQEGLPVSLMEAAASGCAAIATGLPSTRILVKQDETGWLLGTADLDSLVTAVERALDDPQRTRRMGTAARNHIGSLSVSIQDVSNAQMAVYEGRPVADMLGQ